MPYWGYCTPVPDQGCRGPGEAGSSSELLLLLRAHAGAARHRTWDERLLLRQIWVSVHRLLASSGCWCTLHEEKARA